MLAVDKSPGREAELAPTAWVAQVWGLPWGTGLPVGNRQGPGRAWL